MTFWASHTVVHVRAVRSVVAPPFVLFRAVWTKHAGWFAFRFTVHSFVKSTSGTKGTGWTIVDVCFWCFTKFTRWASVFKDWIGFGHRARRARLSHLTGATTPGLVVFQFSQRGIGFVVGCTDSAVVTRPVIRSTIFTVAIKRTGLVWDTKTIGKRGQPFDIVVRIHLYAHGEPWNKWWAEPRGTRQCIYILYIEWKYRVGVSPNKTKKKKEFKDGKTINREY